MTAKLNIIAGPPRDKVLDGEAIELFLEKADMYAVCGGSTALMVSAYVGKELILEPSYAEDGLMTYGHIGDFTVTEGVVTLMAVAKYLQGEAPRPHKDSGAGRLAELFDRAEEIRIIFGTAVNRMHTEEISLRHKEKSLEDIKLQLEKLGKKVEIIKF